ncbi:MAG: hypothetical protein KAS32_12330 [Candidatus Peribacteraceae bacterium]|nr:hypothetical protein [Candidatus Peribacteraceae bacterium]
MENAKFRKLKRIKITSEKYSSYKSGEVIDCHPELAKQLISEDCAKPSKEELTNPVIVPKANIKKGN